MHSQNLLFQQNKGTLFSNQFREDSHSLMSQSRLPQSSFKPKPVVSAETRRLNLEQIELDQNTMLSEQFFTKIDFRFEGKHTKNLYGRNYQESAYVFVDFFEHAVGLKQDFDVGKLTLVLIPKESGQSQAPLIF